MSTGVSCCSSTHTTRKWHSSCIYLA